LLIPLTLSVPYKHLTASLVPEIHPDSSEKLRRLAHSLFAHYGAQNWWPADSPFEVIVGAILVQRTAWRNAELALTNLRKAGELNLDAIRSIPLADLEQFMRPSGFYRQKAQRLKAFVSFLDCQHSGSLDSLFSQSREAARAELLALNGIGPETADTILLYAGGFPVFIVDTYARRLFSRTSVISAASTLSYESLQHYVENAVSQCELPELHNRTPNHPPSVMSVRKLSPQTKFLAEFHACIVRAEIESFTPTFL
jgi:endonuclease-3 related protein